ncbi:hypothetical protein [Calycomorphotria hydatis]|uniref:Uncharacterized protein n=1 Tax=Calycomorphotria hydatis TaxID=2528027 RepID=A0A517T5D4_9PLAN|nr:hypothetical protein [Calycomorphotria hydatis]QDT63595.1 hypothetical protein V22_08190 [Calycomorphotria hydatis]
MFHANIQVMRSLKKYLPVCFVVAVISGCGEEIGLQKYGATGTVLLDGQPVSKARLRFMPDSSMGNSGPQVFSFAKNGTFQIDAKQGLQEGPYQVEVMVINETDTPLGSVDATVTVEPNDDNVFALENKSANLRPVNEEIKDDGEEGEG